MTIDEYQEKLSNGIKKSLPDFGMGRDEIDYFNLVEGAMGMAVKANECIDIIRKSLYDGKEFSKEKYIDRLADLINYLVEQSDAIGDGGSMRLLFDRAVTNHERLASRN